MQSGVKQEKKIHSSPNLPPLTLGSLSSRGDPHLILQKADMNILHDDSNPHALTTHPLSVKTYGSCIRRRFQQDGMGPNIFF